MEVTPPIRMKNKERNKTHFMDSLQLFVLNFGRMKAQIANIMVNPNCVTRIKTPIYNCGACSFCQGNWIKLFILVNYQYICEFITKEICSGRDSFFKKMLEGL